MEILNIGPIELIVFFLIMFFLLGPKGMVLTAAKIGGWIRKLVHSPIWKEIMGYSQEIRELPQKIMDDTGLKETLDEVEKTTKATASELNTTVNEALKDARVPEAEHLRIDTTPGAVPANVKTESQLPKLTETTEPSGPDESLSTDEEQTIAPPEIATETTAIAAVVPVEGMLSEAEATSQVSGEPAQAMEVVENEAPVPPAKKRGRPRKTKVAAAVDATEPQGETEAPVEAEAASQAQPEAATLEDTVLQVEPETVEAPAPKRRGRPRKTEAVVAADQAELEAATLEDTVSQAEPEAVEVPAPKRRGRPRKTATVVAADQAELEAAALEDAVSQAEPETVEVPAPKRRGRPRKTVPAAADMAEPEATPSENAASQAAPEAVEVPAPKRRGRPRKTAPVETTESTAPAPDGAASPRRRGRPRKDARAVEIDEPAESAAEESGMTGAEANQELKAIATPNSNGRSAIE